jgi:hypothetical protein
VFATVLGSIDLIDVAFDGACWLEAENEALKQRIEALERAAG